MECGHRVGGAALRHDITRATFATAALGGDTQFELDFIESHACTNVACNFTIRHSAANANDHEVKALWLAG